MAKEAKDPMDAVLANIEKQMGNTKKPILSRFGKIQGVNEPVIPFGIQSVDDASYCGGVPRGKMVEVFGPESSGKSLITLYVIASAQRQGLDCALLDVEQSFDPTWAKKHGVDVEKLVYCQDFASGEQALEYAYQLCKSGAFGVVAVDSTAALTPLSELEGTLEDNARIGAQAQLMSRGCRKIRASCGTTNTTCLFVNQIRMNLMIKYGNPETTPGGKALKFYSDMRIRVQGKQKITVKEGAEDKVVGLISSVTFVKNRVGRPFGRAEFKIIFDSASMNPVVMLCNEARGLKLIRPYKGLLRLQAEVTGEVVETGKTSILELADYLVKNNLVVPLLDKVIEAKDDPKEPLDGAILEMKDNPAKIVSPTEGDVSIDAEKVADASVDELAEDLKEEKPDEE
jgi:recombination protein RecA